jgi:ABC-type Fe3+ transport system permease subunit
MWERFKRWLYLEYYWWKRKRGRQKYRQDHRQDRRDRRRFGVPVLIVTLAAVVLAVLLSRVIASIYRSFIPFVAGPQIADAYWASIAAALKLSLVFIGIIGVCIVLLVMKFGKRNNKKN